MTISYPLPAGWTWAPLGDLLSAIETGKSFKCDERPPEPGEIGVIKVSAVSWGEYRERESKTCVDASRVNPALFVQDGDFLFSRANTVELVGACVIARQITGRSMLSDKILRFKFLNDAWKPWALHLLRSKQGREQIETLASGNQDSMRNIGQERIGQIQVPVPPAAEQTRIVEKLEELLSDLDAGVAELKAAQQKLQHYRQSLLKAAVEGSLTAAWREANPAPEETGADLLTRILRERRARWEALQLAKFEAQGKTPPKGWQGKYPEPLSPDHSDLPALPAGWAWASVDQLSRSVRNGVSSTPNKDGVGLPILRINAVRPMQVRLHEIRHLDVQAAEVAAYAVEAGDLLATRYNGSVDLLGVFALVKDMPVPVLYPDKLIRVKPVLEQALGHWMEIAANAGASRRYIVGRVKTTAGQTGISGEDLKKMPIPLPPLGEQIAASELISQMLPAIEQQAGFVERGLAQSTAQRQNLLRAAFAGQLVPQDPADEPASALLARIRAEREQRPQSRQPRRPAASKASA